MVVSAGKKADPQRVGMLSSLKEISMHVRLSLPFLILFLRLFSTRLLLLAFLLILLSLLLFLFS